MPESSIATTVATGFVCKHCGSGDTQPCHAAFMAGTSTVDTKTKGGGVIWGPNNQLSPVFASSNSTAVQQTQLAKMCAPPAAPGWGAKAVAAKQEKLRKKLGLSPDPTAWPAAFEAWHRRWVCLRCHQMLDSDPRDSIEAMRSAAASAATELASHAKAAEELRRKNSMSLGKLLLVTLVPFFVLMLLVSYLAHRQTDQNFVPHTPNPANPVKEIHNK